jgi:hypothetical protein
MPTWMIENLAVGVLVVGRVPVDAYVQHGSMKVANDKGPVSSASDCLLMFTFTHSPNVINQSSAERPGIKWR